MLQTIHTPAMQGIADISKNFFTSKANRIKAILTNELTQKIILFTTILGLLLVAANLDAIM